MNESLRRKNQKFCKRAVCNTVYRAISIFIDEMFKLINGRGQSQSENSSKAKMLRKGTYAFRLSNV